MKKKKQEKTKSLSITKIINSIFSTRFTLYIFLLIILIILIGLTAPGIINYSYDLLSVDLVCILLPTIITITTIVLSIMNEPIWSLTRSELNSLRDKRYINVLESVFIVIVIFILYFVFSFFKLDVITIYIDCIAVIFAVYFTSEEIPIMMVSKKYIARIIGKAYRIRYLSVKNVSERRLEKELIISAVRYAIFKYGLQNAYDLFKISKTDKELLIDLLYIQNHYFYEAIDDIEIIKTNPLEEYQRIDFSQAINRAYDNILDLMDFSEKYNYFSIIEDNQYFYLITNTFYCLNFLSNNLKISQKHKQNIDSLLSNLLLYQRKNGHEFQIYALVILEIISNIKTRDIWFIETIRDCSNMSIIFSDENKYLGLFIFLLISYCCQLNQQIDKEYKDKLTAVLNSGSKSINAFGEKAIDMLVNFFESINPSTILDLIKPLLLLYDSINEVNYSFVNNCSRAFSVDDSTTFGRHLIFDFWIELLLYSFSCYDITNDELMNTINNLDDNDKAFFANRLDSHWLKDGNLNSDLKPIFLDFVSKDCYISEAYKPNVEILEKFRSNYFETNETENLFNNCKNDDFKKFILDSFDKIYSSYPLIDRDIDCLNEKNNFISFIFTTDDDNYLLNSYLKQLDEFFGDLVSNDLKNVANQIDEYFPLSDSDIDKILKLKPDNMSQGSTLIYSMRKNDRHEEINIKSDSDAKLKKNIYWKDGAIKFNIKIDCNLTDARIFDDMEMEQFINNNYVKIDNMYKFSNYGGDYRSFLVTKEKLIELIKSKYRIAKIVFKYKTNIVTNDVVCFVKRPSKTDE